MLALNALIIGATGQTGHHLLQSLLASPHFTRVGEYGRKVTSPGDIKTGKNKLEQKVIDFEKIQEYGLKQGKWDVVFITLGTTRANAGSAEAFEKIDREYVVNAAKEARNVELATQRIVYLSSTGANSSSPMLYSKSKGLTEEALASIGYSDTIIFRPGFLAGTNRPDSRVLETMFSKVTHLLSYVSNSFQIQISALGQAMCTAGRLGSQALPEVASATQIGKDGAKFTVIYNAGAIKLAEWKD
jgi:oxidoreductase